MTSRDWSFLVWACLGAALFICIALSQLSPERLPTLGSIVSRIQSHKVGRALLALGWMWLGWHAFAR
jgi:hypothetical protein